MSEASAVDPWQTAMDNAERLNREAASREARKIGEGISAGMVADLEWTICTCPCTCGARK